jgi:hypothetical protein
VLYLTVSVAAPDSGARLRRRSLGRAPVEDYRRANGANSEYATGTSIEVEARITAARGHRDKAVAFPESELPHWKTRWIEARIHRNLDLPTLEDQPAPELDTPYRGSPVL